MEIAEVETGKRISIVISKAENEDFKLLTKKRFSFSWKAFRNLATVYKLQIKSEEDILGVIGLIDWPAEKRMEIKLLASSMENIGKGKRYDGIAGCLIAFACRQAVTMYGAEACVSLVPKTELIGHYVKKYHMQNAGWQLYLDGTNLIKLLKEYL
jgi:hypothetical protein